ncbi:MAG TPA: beta-propeller fold lactonase family protein, partial [Caldilineaceae bacterium]|nr:beta-propeller fold lactonase family protein [Caldilineaceae bacterium]
SPIGTTVSGTTPRVICIDAGGNYLYSTNSGSTNVTVFRINADGTLNLLASVPTDGSEPNGIVLDQTGKYLYVANRSSNNIRSYTVGSDGMLTPFAVTVTDAAPNGFAIVSVSPAN